MNNFVYKNPTKIIFGKGQISKLRKELPKDARIMFLYGGGSIKRNGIYKQVVTSLSEFNFIEFGGITANPEYEVLIEAVNQVHQQNINYILAVGGGSVIDGAKFISAAAKFKGEEPWDILSKKIEISEALPFSTILTLPATGSEMNSGAVISRKEIQQKLSFGSPLLFPQFSILDPTVIESLPQRQRINGIIDAFMHTLEQYLTFPAGGFLQDRFAEGILQTLIEIAPKLLESANNYEINANFMWSCTMALNGLINKGVPTDWGTHSIGHELTALYGIDHARTLAIIAPRYYEKNFEAKLEKLAQYGNRVWNIVELDETLTARMAIQKTEEFFQSLGVTTKLSEYTEDYEGTGELIEQRFTDRGWTGIGEHKTLTPTDVSEIVRSAY